MLALSPRAGSICSEAASLSGQAVTKNLPVSGISAALAARTLVSWPGGGRGRCGRAFGACWQRGHSHVVQIHGPRGCLRERAGEHVDRGCSHAVQIHRLHGRVGERAAEHVDSSRELRHGRYRSMPTCAEQKSLPTAACAYEIHSRHPHL